MDLREYLYRTKRLVTEFADFIGYDRAYIGRVANQRIKPGRKLAERIEEATGGKVTAKELLKPSSSQEIEMETSDMHTTIINKNLLL